MPNLQEKIYQQSERNHIMEQGLARLNLNLEQRRVRSEFRSDELKSGMQQLGAKLDHAEQQLLGLEELPDWTVRQQVVDAYAVLERQVSEVKEGHPEFFSAFEEIHETEDMQRILSDGEKLAQAREVLDMVQAWEYSSWSKNSRHIAPLNIPSLPVGPADGTEAYLNRLIQAYSRLNESAKEHQQMDKLLADIEKSQSVMEEELADYQVRVDQVLTFYGELGGEHAGPAEAAKASLEQYKMRMHGLLEQIRQLAGQIEAVREKEEFEEKTKKDIEYRILTKTVEIVEKRKLELAIEDTGAIIDNVKSVMDLKEERGEKARKRLEKELKEKGWDIADDKEMQELLDEWEEETENIKIVESCENLKKQICAQAEAAAGWEEVNQEEVLYIQSGREHSRAVKAIAVDVEGIPEKYRMNPFTGLLAGEISADSVEEIAEKLRAINVSDGTEDADARSSEAQTKREEQITKAAQKLVDDFDAGVRELHIEEAFIMPNADLPAEAYPCMKAASGLAEQITNMHFSRKRWDSDTEEYKQFLDAAEIYEMTEYNFRTDSIGANCRTEIAQYAVEEAKQNLLDAAFCYLAAKKKMTVQQVKELGSGGIRAMRISDPKTPGRRINAAIEIIDILSFNPTTRMHFDVKKAKELLSDKFMECLVGGLKSFRSNHERMNTLYADAYYQNNLQDLDNFRMKQAREFAKMPELYECMKETYRKLYDISKADGPISSKEWSTAIMCTANVYLFQMVTKNPEDYRNVGRTDLETMAKNLVERSGRPEGHTNNSFFHFVKDSLKCRMDIASIAQTTSKTGIKMEAVKGEAQTSAVTKETDKNALHSVPARDGVSEEAKGVLDRTDGRILAKIDEIGSLPDL